jgi:geranylgeranyl diphosphate synthase type 3
MYMNKEEYCVISLVLDLCIILDFRTDDIQDTSTLRRGIPAAHTVFGVSRTINAACFLLVRGMMRARSLNNPESLKVCIEHVLEMHWGQGLEIYWRDNYICPSFDEYKDMAKRSKDMVRAMGRI